MIGKAIEDFARGRDFSRSHVAGRCYDISLELITYLRHLGVESDLVHLMDYQGDFVDPHMMWHEADFYNHYVVVVAGTSYDFTFDQFEVGQPIPRIVPLAKIEVEWDSVEIETPCLTEAE